MKKKRKRLKQGGVKPGGRWLYVSMEPALWRLLEQLRGVMNARLKEAGRPELTVSGVANLVLSTALLDNAGDIQEDHGALGLHRLAVQLAPLFGDAGLAAAGLPAVPDGGRARRRAA